MCCTRWRKLLTAEESVVTHICHDCSHFIRFWRRSPEGDQQVADYNRWHAYGLPDQSAGYFISNLVASVHGEPLARNEDVWIPALGNERQLVASREFTT